MEEKPDRDDEWKRCEVQQSKAHWPTTDEQCGEKENARSDCQAKEWKGKKAKAALFLLLNNTSLETVLLAAEAAFALT